MGPHDIDDVPRREEREETRQLMLGLIDELPHQERRGILLIKDLGVGPPNCAVYRSGLDHGAKLVIDNPNHARAMSREGSR